MYPWSSLIVFIYISSNLNFGRSIETKDKLALGANLSFVSMYREDKKL